jgi:hypothetical protein
VSLLERLPVRGGVDWILTRRPRAARVSRRVGSNILYDGMALARGKEPQAMEGAKHGLKGQGAGLGEMATKDGAGRQDAEKCFRLAGPSCLWYDGE